VCSYQPSCTESSLSLILFLKFVGVLEKSRIEMSTDHLLIDNHNSGSFTRITSSLPEHCARHRHPVL
jgi:hypothetical protein